MPLPFLIGGAAIGGGLGLLSTLLESDNSRRQLEQQKKTAWAQYLLGREYGDAQYGLQKEESARQLALQQRRLDQGMDRSVAQMNASLAGQAYESQDAQIQAASEAGASLAAEAASGTRGGSGGGLMRAYLRQSLDRGFALQQRQNSLGLAGLAADAVNARQDLDLERASWESGGYRHESWQAQNAYNESLAKLGQTDFDWQIQNAQAGPGDWLLGILGGASSGMMLGGSIYDYAKMIPRQQSFAGIGYGQAGTGYTNNGMSLDWRIR